VDYVRLYLDLEQPSVNERHEWNYELCDDDLTTSAAVGMYYSSTPWLLMALHTSKHASNRTGFRAVYRFVDKRKCQTPSNTQTDGRTDGLTPVIEFGAFQL